MAWWLSYAKPKIKSFFRWKSKLLYDDFHREHQRLYAQLRLAYDGYYLNPNMLSTINRLKGELLKLQRDFSHFFTRVNETHVAGEPLSTFQLGERRRKKNTITHLQSDTGERLTSPDTINQQLQQYFTELYGPGVAEEDAGDAFHCERVIPEQDQGNTGIMSDITTAEIYSAIKTSAPKKSPGSDGLPREFYLRTFDVIHRELNLVLNEALATNFPPDFVDGVIVLVKKKNSDDTAKSYRPISLLNFDYKILARVLKARIESVMCAHHVLSPGQKCSNSNRNIFQATLALKDRIAQLNRRGLRGKLVSFDLDHAFDRVEHAFLFRTMRSLGFNPALVNLLSRIAESSRSRLMINGHLLPAFDVRRSVRQGDPLSMHLFVLYLHPLVSRLERVAGLDLVVAYADDISVVTTSTHKLDRMRALFSVFERASGAKLNLSKTTSIDVGLVGDNSIRTPWLQTVDTIKVLGIIYANSLRVMIRRNWDELVVKFSRLVWLHATRSLTLLQKVVLLNTFISAKMWYLSSVLPPYQEHTSKITQTMGSFLWRGIPARVPIQQLARDREQGGLKLHLPALKCRALLINRHLREIESIPFYKSFIVQANPNPANLPSQFPCLKYICVQFPQLPPMIQQNPSADLLHRLAVEQQTPVPKVERENPTVNWQQIWQNISMRQLSSHQRSMLYLLVNGKIEHRKLMLTMRRADGENCLQCGAAVETLKHKFSECRRVADAWLLVQNRITTILRGRASPSFDEFMRPSLEGIGKTRRKRALKVFIEFVMFASNARDAIDLQSLEFHLDCV